MRKIVSLAAAAAALALASGATASDPGGGAISDDPAGHQDSPLFDGAGVSQVEAFLGSQASAERSDQRARNISLVGALKLDPFDLGVHGDVAGYKNLAFVGKWRGACPGTGVDIIDISRPAHPVKIADTRDYADTSMEDMQAMHIGTRDVLAIGLQDCGASETEGTVGLELYDITNPRTPQFLSLFNGEDFPQVFATPTDETHGHVHELDLTKTPRGGALALLSSPDLEALTSDENGVNGVGDVLIVDITDPANPSLAGEWGVLDDPRLGVDYYLEARQGGDARTLGHSVRANKNGTRAYVSYWDGGYIVLEISDPAHPTMLGHTTYPPGVEGNAHSVDEARGGNVLVAADEDFTPFHTVFNITNGPNAGEYPGQEGDFTVPIATLPDRSMNGSTTFIGLACPGDPAPPPAPEDGNPLTDEIAVAMRGICFFQEKAAAAEAAGYDGFVVMNDAARGDALVLMGGSGATPVPELPGIFVGH